MAELRQSVDQSEKSGLDLAMTMRCEKLRKSGDVQVAAGCNPPGPRRACIAFPCHLSLGRIGEKQLLAVDLVAADHGLAGW